MFEDEEVSACGVSPQDGCVCYSNARAEDPPKIISGSGWTRGHLEHLSQEVRQTEICVSMASDVQSKEWKRVNGSFEGFAALFGSKEGPKNGLAWAPTVFRGSRRITVDAVECRIVGFDFDRGQPHECARGRLKRAGFAATFSSSHSHRMTLTIDTAKRVREFACMGIDEPITDSACQSLLAKKYVPRIAATARLLRIIPDAQTGQDMVEIVHAPVEKYRAVLLLQEPYDFSSDPGGVRWRLTLHNFTACLGLEVDATGFDPNRAFYFPRHRRGHPWFTDILPGMKLDLTRYAPSQAELEAASPGSVGGSSRVERIRLNPASLTDPEANALVRPIARFLQRFGASFRVADMFRDLGWEQDGTDRGRSCFTIACPNADAHSGGRRGGCAAFNPTTHYPYGALKCLHESCSNLRTTELLALTFAAIDCSNPLTFMAQFIMDTPK